MFRQQNDYFDIYSTLSCFQFFNTLNCEQHSKLVGKNKETEQLLPIFAKLFRWPSNFSAIRIRYFHLRSSDLPAYAFRILLDDNKYIRIQMRRYIGKSFAAGLSCEKKGAWLAGRAAQRECLSGLSCVNDKWN